MGDDAGEACAGDGGCLACGVEGWAGLEGEPNGVEEGLACGGGGGKVWLVGGAETRGVGAVTTGGAALLGDSGCLSVSDCLLLPVWVSGQAGPEAADMDAVTGSEAE